MLTFQQLILKLQAYWDAQGCALLLGEVNAAVDGAVAGART